MRVTDHNNTKALNTLYGSNYCKYASKRDADDVIANPAKKRRAFFALVVNLLIWFCEPALASTLHSDFPSDLLL
jgi:hypothetical protein